MKGDGGMLNHFLMNAKLLNEKMQIIPLLYGSLGLSQLISEELHPDDIDMLVPKAFLTERWDEFRCMLEQDGYTLIDEHEHTFVKNGILFAYAGIEELESFAGICLEDIPEYKEDGVRYKRLSLRQYLSVYQASAKDGYRIEVREKKDQEKIDLIMWHLSQ